MKKTPKFDHEKCTMCGKCITICPKDCIISKENKLYVSVDECLLCSHCHSVCRFNAINFDEDVLRNLNFKSFDYTEEKVNADDIDSGKLVNIFRSRRSIRKYSDKAVPNEVISDLIEFAVSAPSGSNYQNWEFTVINGRDRVWEFATEIRDFFMKLNKMAKNPFIRYLSVLFSGKTLINYYKNHLESVEMGIKEAESGRDLLFHGAPAVIILHSNMEGSTPLEDAQYASYNITLLAHSLGLGTCYIGYATESVDRVKKIKVNLGIPEKNKILAVLTIGYPDIEFNNLSLRKNYKINWVS